MPMKMEPTVISETSAIRTQTPGNYPKRNVLNLKEIVTTSGYSCMFRDVLSMFSCASGQRAAQYNISHLVILCKRIFDA